MPNSASGGREWRKMMVVANVKVFVSQEGCEVSNSTVAGETSANPEPENSSQPNSQPGAPKRSIGEEIQDAVGGRIHEIVNGLVTSVHAGKPEAGKILFDALVKLRSNPESDDGNSENCVSLLDLVDPGFDWSNFLRKLKPATGETPAAE
jgi:hypothetical protein